MDPVAALKGIAFLLEKAGEPTYRVRAFRRAAETIAALTPEDLAARQAGGRFKDLPGIGPATSAVIVEALAGGVPEYLQKLEAAQPDLAVPQEGRLRAALRGDCHTHSDWSDGGSPIREMAESARALGHEYIVLTDHSPRLKIANGLSAERLLRQIEDVARLNAELAPFRILTGIEVDILDDGSLDQDEALLSQLDVVVASLHSKLRMDAEAMTRRMVAAIANPHMDILGHCTGRLVGQRARAGERARGGGRAESQFNAEIVFAACVRFGKAVEINSRPERLDPPRRLLALARDMGCAFAIDTDAHAPGQLAWLPFGCERAEQCAVAPAQVVNTRGAEDVRAWAEAHG